MELYVKEPGCFRVAKVNEVLKAARRAVNRKFRRGTAFSSPAATRDYLHAKLAGEDNEVFAAVWLDSRHRLIEYDELFRGTIDGTRVYPRVVVQRALQINAASVIFAHQHPSGVAEPSQADEQITKRLQQALALVDVRVLDHIIVAETCVSLAERGLF